MAASKIDWSRSEVTRYLCASAELEGYTFRRAVAALELSVKKGDAPSRHADRFVRLQKKLKDAGVVLTKATTIARR